MKKIFYYCTILCVLQAALLSADVIPFSSNPYSTFKVGTHDWIVSTTSVQWNGNYIYFMANYGAISTITMQEGANTFQLNSIDLYGPSWSYTVTVKGFLNSTEKYTRDFTVNSTSFSTFSVSGWTGINKVQVINPGNSINVGYDNLNYTPENSQPTDLSISNSSVEDGDPSGTTVGTFTTIDEFVGGAHTCSFASGGTDNASFTISGSDLLTAFVADYDTKNSYSIRIRTTDSAGLWYEDNFTITVNPNAPAAYEVNGAENSNYNGVYSRDGSCNGYPQYSKDGSYYLFNFNCNNTWSLDTNPNTGGPPAFNTQADVNLPPNSGYSQGCAYDYTSSEVTIESTTLDIELLSFYAISDQHSIILEWRTEFESNVAGFFIERSVDKQEWDEIASCQSHEELVAKGLFMPRCEYTYNDESVQSGQLYYYRLGEITTSGHKKLYSELSVRTLVMQKTTQLTSIYPNPFNPVVTINYEIAGDQDVQINIFDFLGRHISSLVDEHQKVGQYSAMWDGTKNGSKVPTGSYIIRLQTKDIVQYEKVVLIR